MMIIYITGLNNIPYDLYEAAEIDGASTFQRFRVITLPMLMPAFTVVFFLTLANCFKLLDQNIALTDGAFGTTFSFPATSPKGTGTISVPRSATILP